jgi:hypothetical protein
LNKTLIRPLVLTAFILSGCAQDPDWANTAALEIGAPRIDAAQIRDRQTIMLSGVSERDLLIEATQVLQDLGFTIEESAARFGVLAGSKDRDATEAGQVAGQIALMIGLALLGAQYNPVYDTDQVIRATLTTNPVGASDASLRVSFERIVTNNQGISRAEELSAAEFSSGFFDQVRAGLAGKG